MFQTSVVDKIKIHILCSITFFFLNHAIYKITWKNIVPFKRPPMKIRCMHIAWLIPKITNTCSEYVILIAFPLQQWLYECISLLHCTYIASLVCNFCGFQDSYTNLCGADIHQACVLIIDSGLVKTREGYQTVDKK